MAKSLIQETGFPELLLQARRRLGLTANSMSAAIKDQQGRDIDQEDILAMERGELVPDTKMAQILANSLWFFKRNPELAASQEAMFLEAAEKAEKIARQHDIQILTTNGQFKNGDTETQWLEGILGPSPDKSALDEVDHALIAAVNEGPEAVMELLINSLAPRKKIAEALEIPVEDVLQNTAQTLFSLKGNAKDAVSEYKKGVKAAHRNFKDLFNEILEATQLPRPVLAHLLGLYPASIDAYAEGHAVPSEAIIDKIGALFQSTATDRTSMHSIAANDLTRVGEESPEKAAAMRIFGAVTLESSVKDIISPLFDVKDGVFEVRAFVNGNKHTENTLYKMKQHTGREPAFSLPKFRRYSPEVIKRVTDRFEAIDALSGMTTINTLFTDIALGDKPKEPFGLVVEKSEEANIREGTFVLHLAQQWGETRQEYLHTTSLIPRTLTSLILGKNIARPMPTTVERMLGIPERMNHPPLYPWQERATWRVIRGDGKHKSVEDIIDQGRSALRAGDKKALGSTFIALYHFSGLTSEILSAHSGVPKRVIDSWISDEAQPSSLNKQQADGLAEAFVGKSPQLASAISATLRSLQEEKTYSELLHDCIQSAALEIRGHNATKRKELALTFPEDHPDITREDIVAGQIGHFITEYRKMTKETQVVMAESIVYEKNGERRSICEEEVSIWQSGRKVLTPLTAEAFARMLVREGRIAEQEETAATCFFAGRPRYYERDLLTNQEGAWEHRDNSWRLRELRHNSGFPKWVFSSVARTTDKVLDQIERAGVMDDERIDRFIEAYGIPEEDHELFRDRFSLSRNKHCADQHIPTPISRKVANKGPALNHRQRARAIHPSPPDIIRG